MPPIHLLAAQLSVGLLAAVLLLECRFLFAKKAKGREASVGLLLGACLLFTLVAAGLGQSLLNAGAESEVVVEHRNAGWFYAVALGFSFLTFFWNCRSRSMESGLVYALGLTISVVALGSTLKLSFHPGAPEEPITSTPPPVVSPTPTPIATATPPSSPSPTPISTPTPLPTPTPTPAPTPTPTPSPSSPPPTATPTPSPSATPAPMPVSTAEERVSAAMQILEMHCVSCHGPDKQKGSYRVDLPRPARGGGISNQTAIIPGNPNTGTFLQRIALPRDDVDAMPPLPKAGVTAEEFVLLRRWIEEGARFPGEAEGPPKRDPNLQTTILALRDRGWSADYVPWDQTKLLIDLSAVDRPEMKALAETTRPLAPKLVWLNASHHQWPAEFFELLPAFIELQRLHLAGTGVTDQDLLGLLNLTQLDYLNLNETAVTVEGVAMLASRLPALRRVNLFGTGLTSESVEQLRRAFPNVAFVGVP